VGACGLDSSGLGQGIVEGSCEECNELADYLKYKEFLDYLSNC
jgi:hypothetical protein